MNVLPLLLLVAGSAAVAGGARRTPVPAPLLLVAAGLAVSYVPGVPEYTLDPDVVLPLVLPPLLYTAAADSSYLDLRAQMRPVALLSVGYVLFATFLTFTMVIGTLVVQGLTLPLLIRVLGLPGRDPQAETLAEANAQAQASRAAEQHLDALLDDERNALPPPLADRLRTVLERRRNAVWERLGSVNPVTGETVDDTYRRLSREMIGTEREVFVRLRNHRYIDDEMLRTLLRRLDLEEAAAYRETA
ncbi:hypothetical protein [Streptomyces sp. NPDC093261]|uniref:hypothetical protein n=1 Tax=Streptomyces sp. NPDC093261 TaxID=3366037 RepID=UPI0038111153